MDVGRFLMAVWVSPVRNSLPSTLIFFTSLPLMVILPSSLTSAPGSRFTSSSMTDPSGVLYAPALYIKVSSFENTLAMFFTTSTSFSIFESTLRLSVPSATALPFMVTFRNSVL